MKKIEAIIKPFKLDEVKEALEAVGLEGVTITEVKVATDRANGASRLNGDGRLEFKPKYKIEVVVPDHRADQVKDAILHAARTGRMGDGKLFILPMHDAIRIRTAEAGDAAL